MLFGVLELFQLEASIYVGAFENINDHHTRKRFLEVESGPQSVLHYDAGIVFHLLWSLGCR